MTINQLKTQLNNARHFVEYWKTMEKDSLREGNADAAATHAHAVAYWTARVEELEKSP